MKTPIYARSSRASTCTKRCLVGSWLFVKAVALVLFTGMTGSRAANPQPAVSNLEASIQSSQLGGGAGTFGWGFMLPLDSPGIVITHVGVFDPGSDGSETAHSVGVWKTTGWRAGDLVLSAEVPSGNQAMLLDGYRYTSVAPLFIPAFQPFVLGAYYDGAGVADSAHFPYAGSLTRPLFKAPDGGLLVPGGGELQLPIYEISRGQEGLPNYEFYPVNFLFEVVPEPSAGWLLSLGAMSWLLLRRRRG